MPTFEERFAAAGRAIDGLFETLRRSRQPRPYRRAPSRRPFKDRLATWRSDAGSKTSSFSSSLAEWRRGMDSAGARRFNLAVILAAMLLTATATWLVASAYAPALTGREAEALSKISSSRPPANPPAPASGPWWNQATTK
jgi:hypothetical protein